jgi:hypothetical protein
MSDDIAEYDLIFLIQTEKALGVLRNRDDNEDDICWLPKSRI